MDIEEEEPEEDPVEEPEPLARHRDQCDAHPNPQPGNMNGWVDDDDDVEEEDDENKDAGVEPEVEEAGDEPEAEGADVELEAEEPDGALKATIRTGSQRLFVVRGLAPWSLRRDLEALRRHERIREAESETSRTEISLLGSEAKIGKMKREILHHDLSGVKETLGKVVDRLKVLKSEENATLKKKLTEKEVLLDLTRMERDKAERKLSESIWWNERFYLEMVRKGAVPKPPSDDEGSERPRKMPKKSDEDEGPSDPHGPLMIMPPKPMSEVRMREIIRDQFATSMNKFMENMNNRAGGSGGVSGSGGAGGSGGTGGNADGTGVRGARPTVPEITGCTYATFIKCDPLPFNGTEGAIGLCQWKWMTEEFGPQSVIQRMEQELYNSRMKGMDIDGYTNQFHELALLCPRMVEPEAIKVEQYLLGLTKSIRGDVTSSQPATINDAGHRKKDCPKLGRNGQGGTNRKGAYQLGAVNVQEDPKVVTGTFLLNNHHATALFDLSANRSFVSTKFSNLINIKPVEIDTSYEVELADVGLVDLEELVALVEQVDLVVLVEMLMELVSEAPDRLYLN
uniref:Retrotransposon gag domain-containing protein n=1 Tax=Tanacetum cinerariifolium TaxID=118510 RepID=A0A699JXZ5_TANCI|nr:hypothetical protein [Tanacetum cinerariifolium]